MSRKEKISIQFGVPEHGWLPTVFRYRDFELEFDTSDVPINPMTQLCDALIQLLKGIDSPEIITWHLEPHCYYLRLSRSDETYEAVILESENLESPSSHKFETKGDFNSIMLPIYRSLKDFHSRGYSPPVWDMMDAGRIEELELLIEKEKAQNKG